MYGADVQDREGGKLPLRASRQRFPFVSRVCADGGYARRLVEWADASTRITLEIIRPGVYAKGFKALPSRWAIEQTFASRFKNRTLVPDYEQFTAVAGTLTIISASPTLLRR